jgi:hypothetical protein
MYQQIIKLLFSATKAPSVSLYTDTRSDIFNKGKREKNGKNIFFLIFYVMSQRLVLRTSKLPLRLFMQYNTLTPILQAINYKTHLDFRNFKAHKEFGS